MKKFLITLIFLTTYNPHKFYSPDKKKDFFFKIKNMKL